VARMTAEEAIREGRLSRAELYKVLRRLSHLRELERISQVGDKSRVRTFHLLGVCKSPLLGHFSPLCPLFSRRVSDLKHRKQEAENCCLCHGTDWKVIPRPEGVGEMAVKCERHVVQIPLLAIPEKSWVPGITRQMLEWRSRQWLRETPLFGGR